MPMYYPDLKSVQDCVEAMRHNTGDKRYGGIYPETEEELPEARIELAAYFREIWGDEIQALEVELGVSEDNYYNVIREEIKERFISRLLEIQRQLKQDCEKEVNIEQ